MRGGKHGRGLRARMRGGRGRGRGGIANVKKIINQNLSKNTNQPNTNINNPRKVVTSTTTTSNTKPNNPNNFTISRTIKNTPTNTSQPQQPQETADQKVARLREQLLNNMKSSPQKSTTTKSKLISGVMTPTQIENQQRKKKILAQRQQKNITKPTINTNTTQNVNAKNIANTSNISPLSALKQKALQSMQPKIPIATKTNQNQGQKQNQVTTSEALQNEKRRQLVMKNATNKQKQTTNKQSTNKQPTIITKTQPTLKLSRPAAFANLISTPIFKSTLNPNAPAFKTTTIPKPKPIQSTQQRPVAVRGPTSIPKPKPKAQVIQKKQPIQSKPAQSKPAQSRLTQSRPTQAAKAVSSPASSAVPRRRLKAYRTIPKAKQNMSFTTTLFDNQHQVVQTTISTNADNKNITKPSNTIVASNQNIKPQQNVVKKPKVNKIPPIPSLPRLPKLPSASNVIASNQTQPIQSKPIQSNPIQPKPKPATKTVIEHKMNENLPLDAPRWSCQFCTFINENNTGLQCAVCMQQNYIKTPVPTEATDATKPPKPVPIPSTSSVSSQPSNTTKPTVVRIQPPTLQTSKPKPIIPVKSTPIMSNKLPTATATKPVTSAPTISTTTKPITITKQHISKPINVAPIKQPQPSGTAVDNKSMDALWAQRDKAILERKQQQFVAKSPKQILSPIAQKVSPMKVASKQVSASTIATTSKPMQPMKKQPIKKPIQKRPVVQKFATTTVKSTQIELQRKRMIAQKQQKPNVLKSNSTGGTPQGKIASNQSQLNEAVFKKPTHSLRKKMASSNTAQIAAVSISMKDYWKMDMKHKLNNKTLELFIKETDQFIKEMNNQTKIESNRVGIPYKDAMNVDNDVVMVDIGQDFEWTKKICLENQVKWPNNFDLNAFEKAVSKCTQ